MQLINMQLVKQTNMNFKIRTFSNFYAICTVQTKNNYHILYSNYNHEDLLRIISSGQGSLTRYFQYQTSINTWITKLQLVNNSKTLESRKIRCVWIKQEIELKFAFARSLWKTIGNKTNKFGKLSKIPIGINAIYNKTDIKKITNEIYFGYCKYYREIELFNKKNTIITGRKSILDYSQKHNIIIQEFFPIINKIR